jgi:hypothetical protein
MPSIFAACRRVRGRRLRTRDLIAARSSICARFWRASTRANASFAAATEASAAFTGAPLLELLVDFREITDELSGLLLELSVRVRSSVRDCRPGPSCRTHEVVAALVSFQRGTQ